MTIPLFENPFPKPPWTGLGKKLESAVRKALYDYQMITDKPIAVALSGGKDSMALLALLKAISGKGFPLCPIIAIHIQGEYTCGAGVQMGFLERFCSQLEIPLHVKESKQKLETLECYSCSRERRRLLFETAKENGADIIALGHHQNDQAQTLLMNLFQKGEVEGMLPKLRMHDYGVTLIRPLIYIAEETIKTFARHYGFLRLSCQCPVGQTSMRRKTEELLQTIEYLYPQARQNLSMAALLYGSKKASKSELKG